MGDTATAAEKSPSTTETPAQTAAETETNTAAETTTTPIAEAPDVKGEGGTAAGVDDYLAAKAKLLPALKSAPPEQSVETEGIPEETPTAAAEPEVVAAAPETTPTEEEHKAAERIRLTGLPDGHLVAAANEIARAEKITFGEAWERVAPKKEAPTAAQVEQVETPQLRSRSEVEAELTAAREERRAAARSADALEAGAATKLVEANEKIEALIDELSAVGYAEAAAEQERETSERTEFENIVEESKAKAVESWPEAGDPESAFSKRMIEIADELEKSPDPNIREWAFEPNSPYVIAQMVAKEQGLLPAHMRKTPQNGQTKPSTPAAAKPALVNQRAVGRPTQPAAVPASGAARTTQGNVEDALGLDKIRSPHEYHKLVGSLTGQKRG